MEADVIAQDIPYSLSLAQICVQKCNAYSSQNEVVNSWLAYKDKWGQDRGGVVRGLEQLTTRAVDFKEQDAILQLKMQILKNNTVSYTRKKRLVRQADRLPTHKLMFLPMLA